MRATSWIVFLLLASLSVFACSPAQPETELPTSVGGETNAPALAAAERGALGKPAVVFFHADWCRVCQKIKPELAELEAAQGEEVAFVWMDIDSPDSRAAVDRYRVSATPTFVLLSAEGDMLGALPGWPGRGGLERTIAQMLESN